METATASSSSGGGGTFMAGPANDLPTPGPHDDDPRHFAITASQVPIPTSTSGSMSPTPSVAGPSTVASPDSTSSLSAAVKDLKSIGTRFHEDCHETDPQPSPRLRSSRMFKGKGKEAVCLEGGSAAPPPEEKKPLRLLDLPVDILKDIVKEVTHTNDLTSLALCHSALHRLATPHIYSRFDIVWPDTNAHAEPRSGVDALTYGLATLVMAEEVFGEAPGQQKQRQEMQNNRFVVGGNGKASDMAVRRRKGNHYAHFTRKFSLGNGPPDWVQEYLITKEGGKMLGTLVALAVARMRSLETFVWDMPTGILRDVWLALSSLGERNDGLPCRLERLWVRWHDNSSSIDGAPLSPPPVHPLAMPLQPNAGSSSGVGIPPHFHPAALDRVEHPSFSVLPPLKSLSVLDIDELAYLDEMAVLVGRSLDKLRELRVGIARQAMTRDWAKVWEGENLQQVDPSYPTAGSLTIGEKRLGGVLGTLTGFVRDMRKPDESASRRSKRHASANRAPESPDSLPVAEPGDTIADASSEPVIAESSALSGITSLRDVLPEATEPSPMLAETPSIFAPVPALENDPLVAMSSHASSPQPTPNEHPIELIPETPREEEKAEASESVDCELPPAHLDHSLQLETLELERVSLSIPVLLNTIDWTRLTSLTLLHCQNHEQLWKTLRRTFAPTPISPTYSHPRRLSGVPHKKGAKPAHSSSFAAADLHYPLALKKIHTNTVSPALISFIRETLAPNSLEVLFLQEARAYSSSVTVEQIYKGALRRHRGSLRKLLIDSAEKGPDGLAASSSRWRRWMLTREVLAFICGGKMDALRELGVAVDYKDWHFFLQHLPSIPHLRSLSLPHLADHVLGAALDPRELALQIVDIVALRPEVEICYVGIANKCFEILEGRRKGESAGMGEIGGDGPGSGSGAGDDDDDDDEFNVHDDHHEDDAEDGMGSDEDEDDDDDDEATESEAGDDSASASEASSAGGGGGSRGRSSSGGSAAARLRLREILFYDDKVAVFRARHGSL